MSDTHSDNSVPAPTAADGSALALTGKLEGETITDKDITVSGSFEGQNLTIISTDYHNDITVEGSMTLVDCTIRMSSEKLSDSAESIALMKGASAQITGGSLELRYALWVSDFASLTIDGTSLSSPTNRFYLYSQGANVVLKNLSAQDGALFQVSEDARIYGFGEENFTATNVCFGAATKIEVGGSSDFSLENCSFRAGDVSKLTFSRVPESDDEKALGYTDTKVVRNCDLSHVKVCFSGVGNAKIDLSGNYWGPGYDTVDKVLAILPSHDNIIITYVLTENPVLPELSLEKPTLTGKDQVTFSWKGEAGCTYRLLVDDKEIYSGTGTSFKHTLTAGEHTYTIVSTDELGNQSIESAAIALNTTAGALSTTGVVPVFTVLNTDATGDGSLAWAIEQANAHSGVCRIEFVESLSGQEFILSLSGLLNKSGFDGSINISDSSLTALANAYGIALYNKEALVNVPEGVQLMLPKVFSFTTDLHGTEEAPVCFGSTEAYTNVYIGSNIADTVISLSNLSYNLSAGKNDAVTIKTATTMADCSFSKTAILAEADFEGTRLQFLELEDKGFWVGEEENTKVKLTDSDIQIASGIVYVGSGSELNMEGGSIDVNSRLTVDGKAIFKKTSLGSSNSYFYLNNCGTTELEDLTISSDSYILLQCYGSDTLKLDGVVMTSRCELTTMGTSELDIKNTKFLSGSEIKLTLGTANKSITGCNLAGVSQFKISGSADGGKIDLSGNYWGEGVTKEDIIKKIGSSYDENVFIIGEVLTEDPTIKDSTIELSLTSVSQKKLTDGKASLSFSWNCPEEATYELTINGTVVYQGNDKTAQYTLGDGTHQYTLTATDAAGNTSSQTGSYLVDTMAPGNPSGLSVTQSRSSAQVTFRWNGVQDASGVSYELSVTNARGATTSYSNIKSAQTAISLTKDSSYTWRVRAVDGKGNYSSWVNGKSFNYDYTAPVVSVDTSKQKKKSKGKARVTLRWSSNESASYTLLVDNKKIYSGSGRSRTVTLKEGKHRYKLTARDASGNSITKSGTWRVDITAPKKVRSLKVKLTSSSTRARFSWAGVKDPSGVTYELAVKKAGSGYTYYRGLKAKTMTLSLSRYGTYSWRVRAKDGSGNYSAWTSGKKFRGGSKKKQVAAAAASCASVGIDRELGLSAGSCALAAAPAAGISLNGSSLDLEQKKDMTSLFSQSALA